jgi:hypothetical protein
MFAFLHARKAFFRRYRHAPASAKSAIGYFQTRRCLAAFKLGFVYQGNGFVYHIGWQTGGYDFLAGLVFVNEAV